MAPSAKKLAVSRLAAFLRQHYPQDLLIPLVPGEKRPMRSHKKPDGSGSPWTWEAFEAWRAQAKEFDVGILLRELCVIDVDSAAMVETLEREFPVLCEVPSEQTAHGRHYYFERSPLADLRGYYDGRRPRMDHVDFKTVCRNGTSGLVAACPSPGKAWIRAPWDVGHLVPIPDALLQRVAASSAPPHRPLRLKFVGRVDGLAAPRGAAADDAAPADYIIEGCTWLDQVAYLAPFAAPADDDEGGGEPDPAAALSCEVVLVPNMDRSTFAELWAICETRLPPGRLLSSADVRRLEDAADFLGVPPKYLSCIKAPYGSLYRFADIASVSLQWAEAALADAMRARGLLADGDAELVALTPALCQGLTYTDMAAQARDARWLCHHAPRRADLAPGARVLVDEPSAAAEAALPEVVKAILRRFPGEVVLAGGAALDAVCTAVVKDDDMDYDLFVCTTDVQRANAVLAFAMAQPGVQVPCVTGTAASLQFSSSSSSGGHRTGTRLMQVVLRLHARLSDVLASFDLAPCRVAICAAAAGAEFEVRCQRSFLLAVEAMACWLPADVSAMWTRSSTLRAFKYYAKGFEVFVPGARRAAMDDGLLRNTKHSFQRVTQLEGAATLFGIEAFLLSRAAKARLLPSDIRRFASATRHARGWALSDYGLVHKLSGTLAHGIRRIYDVVFAATAACLVPGAAAARRRPANRLCRPITVEDVVQNGGVTWLVGAEGPFRLSSPRWDLLYKDVQLLTAMMSSLLD